MSSAAHEDAKRATRARGRTHRSVDRNPLVEREVRVAITLNTTADRALAVTRRAGRGRARGDGASAVDDSRSAAGECPP
jgi:hypothetical protein